ncbi:hypothetical protein A2V68_01510 [candidate division Kazan bacterium RBG_13_50_9]|uniref:Uncharacterized protein n=1 Tax=candidate division Kazan bacterium RBG_13_50_9 TaxID=1798535 RepID=A0A1F4NS01_UNCK3|nr:MAG: hypothetical protein A2V68_01510 [candidate division Kazan bacterium RBG_13_50_9]
MADDQPQSSGGSIGSSREIIEEEVEEIRRASRPKLFGILVVVFVATLVIMIGGLASYYYYTFQSQGSADEQDIQDNWDEVVISTVALTDSFDTVKSFDDLISDTTNSFEAKVGDTNRTLRDVLYNLQGVSSYLVPSGTFINRLNSFLDDYVAYLRELQRLIDKGQGGLLEDVSEVNDLTALGQKTNESYDNLLIADKNKVIQASLPRGLWSIPNTIEELVTDYLATKEEQTKEEEAEKSAANDVATKFMQAYMNRDTDAMTLYLTAGAEGEFSPAVVMEDSSEIKSFKILETRKTGEDKIELDAQIAKETPDGAAVTEDRLFVMLKRDGKWLIDSWKTV